MNSRPETTQPRDTEPIRAAHSCREMLALDQRHVWHPFTHLATARQPVLVTGGRGAILTTADGREIVDGISSWWVNLFGHGHPDIAAAIARQARQLEHVLFAGFTHPPAIRLAERLASLLPDDLNRVFFSDNGSTSVEVALKMAWQYWQNRGQPDRQRVLVVEGGYHGDTLGAMSAGVSSGFFNAWQNQLVPCDVMPWPATWNGDENVAEKESAALQTIDRFLESHGHQIAALVMEPLVQGASGMRMTRPGFVAAVVERVRQRDILVIFDEVMTGFGRTGSLFACQQVGHAPDLICLSKGLTGGFLPMGVTVVSDRLYESFQGKHPTAMFCHGHSYTANPLGCAAALATLELLQHPETAAAWQRIATAHQRGLESVASVERAEYPRQLGTIAAINVRCGDAGYHSQIGRELADWFHEDNEITGNVLLRPLGNVLYLMPPYCITAGQLQQCWQAIAEAIQSLSQTG